MFKSCCIFLFICSVQLFSQKQIDSLNLLLKNSTADTSKLRLYSQLSSISDENNIPLYTKPGIEIAEKLIKKYLSTSIDKNTTEGDLSNKAPKNLKKIILNYYGQLLNCQGVYEISHGNNPEGISVLEKALKVQTLNNDTIQMASTLNNIGTNLFYMGNIPKATQAINESLKLYIHLKDKQGIAESYNNVGNTYYSQGVYSEALKNYFASLKIREEFKDKQNIAYAYNNIGVIYLRQSNYSEALKYYTDSRTTI